MPQGAAVELKLDFYPLQKIPYIDQARAPSDNSKFKKLCKVKDQVKIVVILKTFTSALLKCY